MMAITIWQPWASLIAAGAKPYEFRHWPAPARLVGQRVAIHAGARAVKGVEVADLLLRLRADGGLGTALVPQLAQPLLERVHTSPKSIPLASVICTAILGKPVRAAELFAGDVVRDSDRIDHSIWAWPLRQIEVLEPYQPARGAQGWWSWQEMVA